MFGKKFRAQKLKPESEITAESDIQDADSEITNSEVSPQDNYDSQVLQSSTNRTTLLVQEILKLENATITPYFDYTEDKVIYPILSTIGESPNNSMFLDDLVIDGVLQKQIYEKLIVCPSHPDSISSNLRIYCPKCHSMDIEKLDLFEHKKCGHIIESKNLSFSESKITVCPSCSKEIKNIEQDVKILALWYQCSSCSEKFDDASVKIYCRKHNHDFDVTSGKLVNLFSYRLETLHVSKNSDSTQIKSELVKLLKGFNFATRQNERIKGTSGNTYEIPIYATSPFNKETLLVFIKNKFDCIDESDMNSFLILKLDINPNHTLFVTSSSVNDNVKNLAKHYGINLISDPDFSKILGRVESFVLPWYKKSGDHK